MRRLTLSNFLKVTQLVNDRQSQELKADISNLVA
jgi:hypothetical protein